MKKRLDKIAKKGYKGKIGELRKKLPGFKITEDNPKLIVEGGFRKEYSYKKMQEAIKKYPLEIIADQIRRDCSFY